jgi:hypothetical protein
MLSVAVIYDIFCKKKGLSISHRLVFFNLLFDDLAAA